MAEFRENSWPPDEHRGRRTAEELKGLEIPEREYVIFTSRSGGKGGQNVNKVESKVGIRFDIGASKTFSDEERSLIRECLKNRITNRGELIVYAQEERSQELNRRRAIEIFHELIRRALAPEEERVPTEPTAGSEKRRIEEKRRKGEKKAARQKKIEYE